jgi:soluble lytic murein transglycosylase-like protein
MLAPACFAGEYAVLSNGFRIHADRHETEGAIVRLYANGGVTEMPAGQIAGFEADGESPKPKSSIAPSVSSAPSESAAPLKTPVVPGPEDLVTAAALRNGLPPEFVHSVVSAESAYRTNAVSRKGAIGLMQLMPATASEYGADPTDPRQNVEAGTRYLRDLLLKYQNSDRQVSRALAAYNAGPGAVDRHHGVPPYRETLVYVGRVLRKYEKQAASAKPAKPSGD